MTVTRFGKSITNNPHSFVAIWWVRTTSNFLGCDDRCYTFRPILGLFVPHKWVFWGTILWVRGYIWGPNVYQKGPQGPKLFVFCDRDHIFDASHSNKKGCSEAPPKVNLAGGYCLRVKRSPLNARTTLFMKPRLVQMVRPPTAAFMRRENIVRDIFEHPSASQNRTNLS